jgi:hypothetical protein
MGRINYGRAMTDFKGLGPIGVICDGYYTFGWVAYPLPLTDLSSLQYVSPFSSSKKKKGKNRKKKRKKKGDP